ARAPCRPAAARSAGWAIPPPRWAASCSRPVNCGATSCARRPTASSRPASPPACSPAPSPARRWPRVASGRWARPSAQPPRSAPPTSPSGLACAPCAASARRLPASSKTPSPSPPPRAWWRPRRGDSDASSERGARTLEVVAVDHRAANGWLTGQVGGRGIEAVGAAGGRGALEDGEREGRPPSRGDREQPLALTDAHLAAGDLIDLGAPLTQGLGHVVGNVGADLAPADLNRLGARRPDDGDVQPAQLAAGELLRLRPGRPAHGRSA